MLGYFNNQAATESSFNSTGWFMSGDLGIADQAGNLRIEGRLKDLIIRGGFNVFPRDVEDALLEHPAVAMAGVVGRPDKAKGEEVVAFVSLKPGVETTEDELIAFSKSKLSAYKYPREIHIVPAVPLTPVMKVDRKVLRGMIPK